MPFSWENCLRDEERAAPLTPFPLPLGCTWGGGDGWIEKESEISGLYTSMGCYTSLLTFL